MMKRFGRVPKPLNFLQKRFGSGRYKIVNVNDAVHLIHSNSTIVIGGFVCQNAPEEILSALGERFKQTGKPHGLTVIFTGGPGDFGDRGLGHLRHPGMIKRAIGSHYGQVPPIAALAQGNKIEAYNLPMGSVSRMVRCAASNSPGHITEVGFGTMADPKLGGGKINAMTTEDLIEEIELFGKKYLFYKAIPIDAAIIRGTTADADGNITMEKESLIVDNMIQAMAARSRRGVVLAQVKRIAANGSLLPRHVSIPGTLVDAVVVAKPENHWMSFSTFSNAAATGEIRAPPTLTKMSLDERKIIARRALMEITPNQVVNLGIGMPEGVARVANEEDVLTSFELTTEPGIHGGVGLTGHDFGPAVNYDALLQMNQQFDFYNGGGLDSCFLGMAEITQNGDVNVTRVGPKLTGPGGFIDISQCTRRVHLLGTFTAGGLKTKCVDGKLVIEKEGKVKKFVKSIPEITFSGNEALRRKQVVLYITERCVFSLTKTGVELTEVAPGIDVQTQILDLMDFKPSIREPLGKMHSGIFKPELMKLKDLNFGMDIEHRFHYAPDQNTVYANLHNLQIVQSEDIIYLRNFMVNWWDNTVKQKAHVVANYDGFDCRPELMEEYEAFIAEMKERFYLTARRYSSQAFTRQKLATAIKVEQDRNFDYSECCDIVLSAGYTITKEGITGLCRYIDKSGSGKLTSNELQTLIEKLDIKKRS